MSDDELKSAIEQLLLDYNTPTHPSWSLRDYLLDFAASLLAAQRERDAKVVEYEGDKLDEYRISRKLAAAIRAAAIRAAQEDV